MNLQHATTAEEQAQPFIERYGGWILSICFHVILFSALLMMRQPSRPAILSTHFEPIQVTLADPEGEAAALAAAATAAVAPELSPALIPRPAPILIQHAAMVGKFVPPKIVVPEKSATAGSPVMVASAPRLAAPAAAKGKTGPGLNPKAGGTTMPGPATPGGLYAQGSRVKRGLGIGDGPGTEAGRAGSPSIDNWIRSTQADIASHKTLNSPASLFAARQASEAAIRELTVEGAPGDKIKQVMDRYGISVLAVGGAGGGGFGYQSLGEDQAQFVTNFGKSGGFGLFRFSTVAANRMMQLEEAALRARGDDLANTRIVKVTFGIVNTTSGWDLGVLRLQTELLHAPRGIKNGE